VKQNNPRGYTKATQPDSLTSFRMFGEFISWDESKMTN